MSLSNELRTTKSKVETILYEHPDTRDNDKYLWLAYMNKYHSLRALLGEEAYKALRFIILHPRTPLFESVRRVRQKLQEEGKYLGKKRKQRKNAEQDVRDWTKGV